MPKLKNPNQERFCKFYATKKEFFGNGMESYAKAYGFNLKKNPKDWNVCRAAASRLLRDLKICMRITELIELSGFNDQHMDKQLFFMATQYHDGKAKISAVKEYNALKGRITQHIDNTHRIEKMEELEKTLKQIANGCNATDKPRRKTKGKKASGNPVQA